MAFNFLGFMKAFDNVHREDLWKSFSHYGILAKTMNLIKALYDESVWCVRTKNGNMEWSKIVIGIKQSCILSAFLFCIAIDFVSRKAIATTEDTGTVCARDNM